MLVLAFKAQAQMVNIESQRMQTDSLRRAGHFNLSLSYQENNNAKFFTAKSALMLQYKSKSLKDIFMVIGNYDLAQGNTTDFSNSGFAHFRYTRKLNSWLRWEAFSQVQYNKLLSVGMRWLTGTGPRFKLLGAKNAVAYFGTLYMYEYEEVTGTQPEIHRDHRLSSYLTMTFGFPKISGELVSTTYFQPRLNQLDDFRLMQQTQLVFNITKKFKWATGFSFLYDAFPPEGVTARAITLDQGFRLDF